TDACRPLRILTLISLLLCCVRRVSSRVEETTRAAGVGLRGCAPPRRFLARGGAGHPAAAVADRQGCPIPGRGGYRDPLKKLCAEKSMSDLVEVAFPRSPPRARGRSAARVPEGERTGERRARTRSDSSCPRALY